MTLEFIQSIKDFLDTLDSYLGGGAWFPYVLLGVGLFFTIYLKFPQIRFFGQAFRIVRGKYRKDTDEGDTSNFQALTTALSGTVGTGNISGVAFAIYLGGPAALFWMWATAFLGMTTKFVEVTLSHKYRVKTEHGTMAGGPMYFMERGLNMKWLGVIFAIAILISSFGSGNMPQINSIAQGMEASFGIEPIVTGAVLAVLLGLVIIGGIKRIAHVTAAVVPTMAAIYLIGALAVILAHSENILPSLSAIFSDVFSGSAATGGFIGASFAYAFKRGVNRGLFSNEAGQGSAPIAHASAKADEPVSEGMVSILEPFIDTIIICSITGLVILSSGVWTEKHQNTFDNTDMLYLSGELSEKNSQDHQKLYDYLVNENDEAIVLFSGEITVIDGKPNSQGVTLINSHSLYS